MGLSNAEGRILVDVHGFFFTFSGVNMSSATVSSTSFHPLLKYDVNQVREIEASFCSILKLMATFYNRFIYL